MFDTGAHKTIITPEQYHLIPGKETLKFRQAPFRILQADGSEVKVWGIITVEMRIGGAVVIADVTVAEVSHGVLGMDFIWRTKPIIDFNLLQLTVGGTAVPLRTRNDTPLQLRVVTTEEVWIPADHEMVIPAAVMGIEGPAEGLIEPLVGQAVLLDGFQVARAVVVADDRGMVPIRILNVGEQTKILKRGTAVAKLLPVEDCEIVETRIMTCVPGNASPESVPDHLQDLMERCTDGLDEEDTDAVKSLLSRYSDVFSTGDYDIGRTTLVKHRIDTGDAAPIRQPLRRASPEKRAEIEKQVSELLDKKLIEPSDSPWSSPVVLVAKKDGTKRLCLDYRKLNDITVKDAYPIPRIDDALDALGGAKWFSTLDLAAGYWQVALDQDAKDKTAFSTPSGLYSWNVLPFGLCNAPSTFERLMERVLAGLRWETLLVYLDDIIIFGRTIPESIERLEEVFTRLRSAGLKLKPGKCNLLQREVTYLGHLVSEEGIRTDPGKTDAVRNWPTPVTVTQVRSFLGLASYYRRFIKSFADIAHPLHRLTEKKAEFKWSIECDKAFNDLKQALISAPVLAYPQAAGDFIIDTDASAFAIGGVLSQVHDGVEKPIAYGSTSLSKSERNYCVTRRELLAVVTFLKKYRHYIGGRKVKVRTDHGSLRWLCNFKNPEAQLARWLEVLSTFNMELEYRPGSKHVNADALSRKPCRQCVKWKSQLVSTEKSDQEAQPKNQATGQVSDKQCDVGVQTEDTPQSVAVTPESPDSAIGVQTEATPQSVALTPESPDSAIAVQTEATPQSVAVTQESQDSAIGVQTESTPHIESAYENEHDYMTVSDIPRQEPQINSVQAEPEITLEAIREAQLDDDSMSFILKEKEKGGDRPSWEFVAASSASEKTYWSLWNVLAMKEGVLVKRWENGDGTVVKWLTVLPKTLRKRVLDELHASPTAGHLGRNKTLPKVQERYYWVRMTADVRSYVKQCTGCARKKSPPKKHRAPLKQLPVGAPMERIAIDVLGPLTETADGNSFILVVGDYHTKWMETYAIPNQQAETVASKLVEQFVCRFGVPAELHSDQGRNFESQVFKEMCKILNITKTRTTPYNPKSDGMVERFNRTIVNSVALMIQPHQHQTDWDKYLPFVGMAYRSSVQASTGETPNMMMTGREVRLPVDLVVGAVPDEPGCATDYAEGLRERVRAIHERARHALKANMRRQKRNYDRLAHGPIYRVGQFVWLLTKYRKAGLTKKLGLPWEGPYLVVTSLSDVTFRIQRSARSKPRIVHGDRLKPYEGPELIPWEYSTHTNQQLPDNENEKSLDNQDNGKPTKDTNRKPTEDTNRKPTKDTNRKPTEDTNRKPIKDTNRKPTKDTNRNPTTNQTRTPCKWHLRQERKKPARFR